MSWWNVYMGNNAVEPSMRIRVRGGKEINWGTIKSERGGWSTFFARYMEYRHVGAKLHVAA